MEKCGIAISDKGHRIVGKYSSEVGIVEILDDFVRNQKVKVYTVKQCFCCWLLIFRTRFNRFKKQKEIIRTKKCLLALSAILITGVISHTAHAGGDDLTVNTPSKTIGIKKKETRNENTTKTIRETEFQKIKGPGSVSISIPGLLKILLR